MLFVRAGIYIRTQTPTVMAVPSEMNRQEYRPTGLLEVTEPVMVYCCFDWIEQRTDRISSAGGHITLANHRDVPHAVGAIQQLLDERGLVFWRLCTRQCRSIGTKGAKGLGELLTKLFVPAPDRVTLLLFDESIR